MTTTPSQSSFASLGSFKPITMSEWDLENRKSNRLSKSSFPNAPSRIESMVLEYKELPTSLSGYDTPQPSEAELNELSYVSYNISELSESDFASGSFASYPSNPKPVKPTLSNSKPLKPTVSNPKTSAPSEFKPTDSKVKLLTDKMEKQLSVKGPQGDDAFRMTVSAPVGARGKIKRQEKILPASPSGSSSAAGKQPQAPASPIVQKKEGEPQTSNKDKLSETKDNNVFLPSPINTTSNYNTPQDKKDDHVNDAGRMVLPLQFQSPAMSEGHPSQYNSNNQHYAQEHQQSMQQGVWYPNQAPPRGQEPMYHYTQPSSYAPQPPYPHQAPTYPHPAQTYSHQAPTYPHQAPTYPHSAPVHSHPQNYAPHHKPSGPVSQPIYHHYAPMEHGPRPTNYAPPQQGCHVIVNVGGGHSVQIQTNPNVQLHIHTTTTRR
ncbi:ataxin-2-like protein-like [Planoprotostelium fungivorum]|uniref:Ataxin-2-like protein-like n=1 Tax=Planoprotostelium fungivorum TaxID=1890364 RepID=A0A2P6MV08_9EUKA|nr:ataxin-2-like protein-like [Planoprotostelium fungivorum]